VAATAALALIARPDFSVSGASAAAPKSAIAHLPTIEQATLANGLRIAVLQVDAAPVVAVQVWYHAGSKDEPGNRRGSAHMFEHMMFKGTQHVRAEAHAQFLNGIGGAVNAQTDEDATHYVDTVPSDYLDFAIQLEAERMRGLLIRKPMVDAEREVVKEEIRQSENSPLTKGFLRFLQVAYTHHPYAWTAGGTISDLDATSPEDLQKFYDTYYQPNNAMLVVVGKTTLAQVQASAEHYFGPIAKAPTPPRPAAERAEPAQIGSRREVVEPSQIGLVLVGWHIPPASNPDVYALQVASIILGSGESSRLKQKLKAIDPATQKPYALDGGVESLVREDPGLTIAVGVYRDAKAADAIEALIQAEVAKLGKTGPTAEELRKAKTNVQSGFVFSLEHAQGLAEAIGRAWILTGDPQAFLHQVDQIEKVTAADVQRVVKTYLQSDRATVVVIPSKGS
jgi:zinc protease